MQCIVHYNNQSSYSAWKRIEIGGAYEHAEQCSMIPETIDIELHRIHLEPCYKRYDYDNYDKLFSEQERECPS